MIKSDSKRNFKNKIEEKLHNDKLRMLKYLNGDKYSNEILVPLDRYLKNNHINQIIPLCYVTREGKYSPDSPQGLARPKYFYISNQEKNNLYIILHKYKIPKKLYDDFLILYIGIILWDSTSTENPIALAALKDSELNFIKALDFFNSLAVDAKKFNKIDLNYYEFNSLKTKSIILKGEDVSKLFNLIFKGFLESNDFKLCQEKCENIKIRWSKKFSKNKIEKNPAKRNQLRCTEIIYEYLRTKLYLPAFELRHDSKKCNLKIKELKRKYNNTIFYDFIGELFALSGISFGNKKKGDFSSNIKKKLIPYRKNYEDKLNEILNRNNKEELRNFEFPLFFYHHFN